MKQLDLSELWDNPIGTNKSPVKNTSTNTEYATSDILNKQTTQEDNTTNEVSVEDKRVVNGKSDINQLAPFKYAWAWEFFLNANKNHWTPTEIHIAPDIKDYQQKLTTEEKHVFETVFAYLTTADILAMRNIGLAVMEKMTAPELQIYQARQVYEESLHSWSYQYCVENLGIDQYEFYNRYRRIEPIWNKIQISNRRLEKILTSEIDLSDKENLKEFILSYIFFAAIFEGAWFYNGFSPIYGLQRRGLMRSTSEMLQYIQRDESLHTSFGIRVIKQIMIEEDIQLEEQDLQELLEECHQAEETYIGYVLRDPILGYNKEDHMAQYRFLINRRWSMLGFQEPYPGQKQGLPWLDEQINIKKEKNFFETRVTEYQVGGGLKWD